MNRTPLYEFVFEIISIDYLLGRTILDNVVIFGELGGRTGSGTDTGSQRLTGGIRRVTRHRQITGTFNVICTANIT